MSKNASGYMGPQVGKLGPAVGYLWKGRNVYRAYNPFPRNPKTPEQILHRAKFSMLNQLARAFSTAINFGFDYKAKSEGTLTRGLFVHANKNVVTGSNPESLNISYQDIVVSDGSLTPVYFNNVDFETQHQVKVTFTPNSGIGNAQNNDTVFIVVYNSDVKECLVSQTAKRSEGQASVNIPAHWEGMHAQVYGFAVTCAEEVTFIESYNGNVYPGQASESSFIGAGTLS